MPTPIRVLVVDDFEVFRNLVIAILRTKPEYQIVGEASDGLDAVAKARDLRPDLILLDIGIPKLNGIEVALSVGKLSPNSKILFISQQTSPDLVKEVFRVGASGYVVKGDAARQLIPAVESVLRGERFLDKRFAGLDFPTSSRGEHPGHKHSVSSSKELANESSDKVKASTHKAEFYRNEASLLDKVTEFLVTALDAGNAAIVLVTDSHRRTLLQRLRAHGIDVDAAIRESRYIVLDVADILCVAVVNGMFDRRRALAAFSELLATAAKSAKTEEPRVAIFGECGNDLCGAGNSEAALQLEEVGSQVAEQYNVDILCGYSLLNVQEERLYENLCQEHTAVSLS